MALGVGLVLVSIVASVFRSIPRIFLLRVATAVVLLAAVLLLPDTSAVLTAAIVVAVLVAELKWEQVHHWSVAAAPTPEESPS